MFHEGQKVIAFPGGNKRVGFFLSGPTKEQDEDGAKCDIQVGSEIVRLGYREPQDYDKGGRGGTFRLPA